MPDIWQTEPDKPLQNVRFQGGICPEKCELVQIQNYQLEAIIDFIIGNIGKTVSDS